MGHFTEQALIFISAAIVLVPLFQRLGLGSVLGYLIAGMVVGPYGLKLFEDAESVLHFSEIGVVFLLFIIGLEIQPRKLWSMRKHLFGYGFIQVAATTVLICFALALFGVALMPALILGFALSLSSTAFAVQTLTEKNQFNTEFGRNSFSILLMQDLLAIPMLAIVASYAGTEVAQQASGGHFTKILYAFGIIVFLIVLSRYVMRPVFRAIAATRSREVFTAVDLFIVLGVAALMQKAGLSAALGTFLAGVLLADSEYRHELEANIEPFKGLLMGLFFIAVGMGVSLDLILKEPLIVLALSLGYLILKSVVIYGIGRIFKMNHQSSKMMALAIAQGGEFAFVIFGSVSALHIVDSKLIDYLTVMITLSMALNPLISLLDQAFTKVKKIVPEYDQIKDETPDVIIAGFGRFGQTFGRILRAQGIAFVAIDHDAQQVELIRRFGNQVYYGDASRKELLETAGASTAKFFVLAIDDVEQSLKTAELVRTHFPHLRIFARARNRGHVFDLMELGITDIKREMFDSSVSFTKQLLVALGFEKEKAMKIIERFRTHDEVMIREQFKVRQDDKSFISVSQQGMAQLTQVLNDDNRQTHIDLGSQPEK